MADGGKRPLRFQPRACAFCGQEFWTSEPTRKYCPPPCRTKANEGRRRRRKQGGPSMVDVAADDPPPWEESR